MVSQGHEKLQMRGHVMNRRYLTVLLMCLWTLGIAQCGAESGLSKEVTFTVASNRPVVVDADFTLFPGDENELEVKGPWFLFKYQVKNESDETLYLATLKFKGRSSNNGSVVTHDAEIDPSITCTEDGFARPYLAIMAAGTTFRSLNLTPVANEACDPSLLNDTTYEGWYIEGLPESDTFSYQFTITGEGWFEDADGVALERLRMTGYVTTQ